MGTMDDVFKKGVENKQSEDLNGSKKERFENPNIIGHVITKNWDDLVLYKEGDGALAVKEIFSKDGKLGFVPLSDARRLKSYDNTSEKNVYVTCTSNNGGSSKLYGPNLIRYIKLNPENKNLEIYEIEDANDEDFNNMRELFSKAKKVDEKDADTSMY